MSKRITLSANDGDWVREIREAIADGRLPKGSRLGGRAKTAQGNFPKPTNAVGQFKVRPKEYYWIIA